jgi:hypothetical protein
MAKADLELVKVILERNEFDVRQISRVMEDLQNELKAMEEEQGEKPPPVKKQFCMLVSDPRGELVEKDFVGWVLQIPEDDEPRSALEKLIRSAYEHNITPKGRRMPVKTIAEVCEHVSARVLKEQDVWVKTKEPVYVLRTDNRVPLDDLKKLQAADRE